MKTSIFAFLTLFLVSCSSDDDSNNSNDDQFANIVTLLPQGNWRVSSFIEGENDQTQTFESFVFEFEESGTVTATNDIFSETGNWNYESSSSSDEKLNLDFGETNPFDELTEDWRITTANSTTISLFHVSGGDGSEDFLIFTKI